MTERTSLPLAAVITGGVLFGSVGTVAAFGPSGATPAAVGGLRLVGGAVVLVALLPLVGGRWRALPDLLRRPALWAMGACAAVYQPLFFGAVQRSGVAVATVVAVGASPVFAGLVGWGALRHRPPPAWVAATAVAVVGLVLRSWDELELGDPVGLLMAVVAALGVACYLTLAKSQLERGAHVVELPATAYLLGSFAIAPLVLAQPLGWTLTWSGFGLVAYLGVVTMGVANVLATVGLRGMGPGPASTLLLTDPVTATVLGVLVLHETIPPVGLVGLLLILAGLVLQGLAVDAPAVDAPAVDAQAAPVPPERTVPPPL